MDIWIIRNGEKYGPFHDYDIRRKIEADELTPDSPAWHEGLPEWTTLSKIQIFENEFKKPVSKLLPPVPEVVAPSGPAAPPPIPGNPKIFRRFWARWFDIQVYIALWWLILWAAGRDLESIFYNQWIIASQLVPWFIIEILLIHHFATTPGKWLLGIRVLNADGSHLDLTQSIRRAFRVYVLGIGLGWYLVSLFCMGLSAYTTRKIGAPIWDHLGKHRVTSALMSPWKLAAMILFFYGALQLQMGVYGVYPMKVFKENLSTPEAKWLKDRLEQNPPWSLPRRHK